MNDIIIATGSGDGKFPEGLILYYNPPVQGEYGLWEADHLIGQTNYPKIYHDYEKWILGYGDVIYFQSFQSFLNPVDVTVWDYIKGTPPTPTLQVYTPTPTIFVANKSNLRYSKKFRKRKKHGNIKGYTTGY